MNNFIDLNSKRVEQYLALKKSKVGSDSARIDLGLDILSDNFEVVNKKCVEIWGPTNIADKYLPSPSVAATTFGITIVATSAATLTPILTKALKPLFKQLVGKVKKLLGKKEKKLTRSEIKTNLYRQKRDLPPLKK